MLRDNAGSWSSSFVANLGSSCSILAELWGLFYGLQLATSKGLVKVLVELDSKVVVDWVLSDSVGDDQPFYGLSRNCHDSLSRNWEVQFRRVFCEANSDADGLSRLGHSFSLGFHDLASPPSEIGWFLFADGCGASSPRVVSL